MNIDLKKNIFPHLIAILVFIAVSAIFTGPLFQGKKLKTHDYSVWLAISQEHREYQEKEDRIILWTNSMFGGMPTYVITTPKMHNIFDKILRVMLFNNFRPFDHIFWYFMGFYLMLLAFKVDPRISLVGALAFGLSSYSYIIITAGHVTKSTAIGFMAPIIGGVYIAYHRRKIWTGMALMSFFLAMQILPNHVQIVYYTFMIALVYAIFEFINAIRKKYLPRFIKTSAVLALGAILAVGINAAFILTNNDYVSHSIRGASELSSAPEDRTSGLDRSYATQWSYGIDETFTLLIPNMKGGATGAPLSNDSETFKAIERVFGPHDASHIVQSMPLYFGNQPFTSGPVYVGAFVVFLFVFGAFVVKGRIKWWLIVTTIMSIMLAWGHNFMWLTDLFFDYFPFYNKFRVVAMTLVIAELTIPLLAFLAVWELIKGNYDKTKVFKWFYIALGSTAFITLIYIAVPTIGGIESNNKPEYTLAQRFASSIPSEYSNIKADFKNNFINGIHKDRASMVRKDAARSLLFIVLGAGLIYLFITKKIKSKYAIIGMAVIVLIDMVPVNKRYLSAEHYDSRRNFERPYLPSAADNFILNDSEKHFRVLNLYVHSFFNDGSTSMFHKSVGGYHGAKMRRYQEVYDSIMFRNYAEVDNLINAGFQNGLSAKEVQELIDIRGNFQVLNMLNTKYFIIHPEMKPIINNKRFGNAWFVDNHIIVENADEEMNKLMIAGRIDRGGKDIRLDETAIIDKRFKSFVKNHQYKNDENAYIRLIEYAPDRLTYEFNSKYDKIAIFSEIYFPKGWNVYIDGELYEESHFRANYILRGMRIPKTANIIEFVFEPESYRTGVKISYLSSILLILIIIASVYFDYKNTKKSKE